MNTISNVRCMRLKNRGNSSFGRCIHANENNCKSISEVLISEEVEFEVLEDKLSSHGDVVDACRHCLFFNIPRSNFVALGA